MAEPTPARLTLPARYYTDPDLFERELDVFYSRMWTCVGRAEEIEQPGAFITREIARESIVLVRQPEGTIGAFYNVCRHRGTRLCPDASGHTAGHIQCPYHAWTYDLHGRLIGAPHPDGVPGFDRSHIRLAPVSVDEWDGLLFVCLDQEVGPLRDQLWPLPARFAAWNMGELRRTYQVTYDVHANWKLIVQNYSECLHCPVIHPALQRLSHYMTGDNDPATDTWLGGSMLLREETFTMSRDGRQRRPPLPGLDPHQRRHVYYYAILPNLLLSLHPDYVMTHTLRPRAADRTEIVCEWLFHPDEHANPAFDPGDVIDFWDETNRQDWRVSELSQLGIASRAYEPGHYSSREGLLWDFDQLVRRRLGT
jgi:Rieske 2Fe-2S family protein